MSVYACPTCWQAVSPDPNGTDLTCPRCHTRATVSGGTPDWYAMTLCDVCGGLYVAQEGSEHSRTTTEMRSRTSTPGA